MKSGHSGKDTITVVSGLPRSGTSMMMQILAAAGGHVLTDDQRPPDEDNPLGYFEYHQATTLAQDTSWLPAARGKVVKVVAQLLPALPKGEHYNVIFMDRDLNEVIASQAAMLARRERVGAEMSQTQLIQTYKVQVERVLKGLSLRPEVRLLKINYDELLTHPKAGITSLAEFLGPPFDESSAAAAIRPTLRRQKSHSTLKTF